MSLSYYRERLAAAEERLLQFTQRVFPGEPFDHGTLQLERAKRGGNIDSQIDEWKRLTASIAYWRGKIRAVEMREARQGLREEKAQRHEAADLKAKYGHCTEVFWTLAGRWFEVERWNRKSVKVRAMVETIPHDQVGGAR